MLLDLVIDPRESREAWQEFLYDLARRGLREPVLLITNGNLGLLGAVQIAFPNYLRQRHTFPIGTEPRLSAGMLSESVTVD